MSNKIFSFPSPEFIGRMPIKTELTVISADKADRTVGFKVTETIGVGVFNSRGMTGFNLQRAVVFFNFALDDSIEIMAETVDGLEASIFVHQLNVEKAFKIKIGTMSSSSIDYRRLDNDDDEDTHWDREVEKYERWPECLQQLHKSFEVASVMFI
jgi:hypothetical protein